jgi:hypothetical protein
MYVRATDWSASDRLLIQENDWEALWPLVIPPIMTMLGDHEMKVVSLESLSLEPWSTLVPTTLLRHTGVGELIEKVSGFLLFPLLCSNDILLPIVPHQLPPPTTRPTLANSFPPCQPFLPDPWH